MADENSEPPLGELGATTEEVAHQPGHSLVSALPSEANNSSSSNHTAITSTEASRATSSNGISAVEENGTKSESVHEAMPTTESSQSSSRPQSIIIKPIGVNLFQRVPLPHEADIQQQQSTILNTSEPQTVPMSESTGQQDQPITMKVPLSGHLSTASNSSSTSSHLGHSSEISLSTLSHHGPTIIAHQASGGGGGGGSGDPLDEVTIFSELSTLCFCPGSKNGQQLAWKETARWVKYEEIVEESGTRWSKPYVSTVNLAAFLELKNSLSNGIVILDSASSTLDMVVDEFLQLLRIKNLVSNDEANHIYQLLMLQKRHLFQNKKSIISSIADLRQSSSSNFLKLLSRSSSKINCTNVDALTPNQPSPLTEDVKSEMTRSQSNYSLKNDNGDSHLAVNGNGSLIKNSFSSTNLAESASKMAREFKFNEAFLKKIPLNALSNNILVGEVDFLSAPISGFVRLHSPCQLGDITEVSVPTKFIYIYLGPKPIPPSTSYVQIGRALATLMSDSVFRSVALRTQSIDSLIVAIDEFLAEAPILPPNLWDPATRIEPPEQTPKSDARKSYHNSQNVAMANSSSGEKSTSQSFYNQAFDLAYANESSTEAVPNNNNNSDSGNAGGGGHWNYNGKPHYFLTDQIELDSEDEEEVEREKMGLVRTGRLFGGLIGDIKRKLPHYKSDFTDAFALQSIASIIFLYFACLTPIITFGGLLGDATGNNIATMESLVCGALCGILYGFFSGQPLTILGSTGPVLVFETIVYDFCTTNNYNYLSLRFWIGMWIALILLIFVATDLSYLVCYITRFTEENFASLISVIFIYKAIEKVIAIDHYYPMNTEPNKELNYECSCKLPNLTNAIVIQRDQSNQTAMEYCLQHGGILFGRGCTTPNYIPDVFLFSFILFIFTYIISVKLKDFRQTRFLGAKTREYISDFSVPIAITVMTVIDGLVGIGTPKLQVPSNFEPTLPDRVWIVHPFVPENPVWMPIAAVLPAILGTILIFMDQQITAVIVNRKENKLKKGCGYHLDLFVLCILIAICSVFGLPWFVAATVLSITHVNSLTVHSESAAPGDKPKFLGVREQRVTQIIIFVLCGLSIFFTPILQHIPMPVLYGVFLYMGISSLKGSQLINRILIVFMPSKYQPDYMFLRQVNIGRVHLFTAIQFICFVFLWVVKSVKPISILFPLMLVVILGVRWSLNCCFSTQELKILDDNLPESKRKKKERAKAKLSATKKRITEKDNKTH